MNTDRRAFNVIEEPIIRVELTSGARERLTLPQVFAALVADRVETWPALRPHQAPAWHAFLVQIAAMGLEAVGRTEPPGDDDATWAEVLRALTPEWPNDEPWCLVAPPRSLVGGTVLVEKIFSYPGIGNMAIDAVINRDLPLIQGLVLTFAVLFITVNLLVDMSYALLDPRMRHG